MSRIYHTLEDTVYFGVATNLTTGAAGDGTSPTFAVRKAGASSSAAPTLTGTMTLLSNAGYSDGSYEIAIAATTANGFETGATYLVFCSLTISTVTPNGYVGSFMLSPVNANVTAMAANTMTAAASAADFIAEIAAASSGLTSQNITDIGEEVETRLHGNALTISQPVRTAYLVETIKGMAYDNDYGNRIEWPGTASWPTLTGATITVKIGQDGTPLTFTGVVITATGDSKRVGLELTETQSNTITVSSGQSKTGWRYLVYATISGDDVPLVEGRWISTAQPT